MRFQAKPFAVEVKRNRKNTTRPLLVDAAPQAPVATPPTAARALAESLFGSFTESSEPSSRAGLDRGDQPPSSSNAGSPAVASDVSLAPARRILPDLRRDLSKAEGEQEAEARSPAKAPRARRRRGTAAELGLSSADHTEPAAKKAPPPKKPQIKSQRKPARTSGQSLQHRRWRSRPAKTGARPLPASRPANNPIEPIGGRAGPPKAPSQPDCGGASDGSGASREFSGSLIERAAGHPSADTGLLSVGGTATPGMPTPGDPPARICEPSR